MLKVRYVDRPFEEFALTLVQTMCGTPSYLAPEVVQNNEHGYGYVVDSWSVGVIVFSMSGIIMPSINQSIAEFRSQAHRCQPVHRT